MSDNDDTNEGLRTVVEEHEAMEELAWRFCAADASVGVRAQNMGDVKGSSVFDDAASHDTHMRFREAKHRWAVNRLRAVDTTLWAVSPEARAALTLAFTPGGRVDAKVATHFEIAFGLQRASILGWALKSRAMRSAWEQHHNGVAMPDQDQLLQLVNRAHPSVLKTIMRGALVELQPHLAEYIEARGYRLVLERQQREVEKRRRAAHCDLEIARSRERIWGKA